MSVRTEEWREAAGPAPSGALPRNEGTELILDWVQAARVNRSAVERRAATLTTRRSVKKQWQAAWLLKAITLIDLTTLAGDDTPGRVRRLCAKALNPVREDLLEALGVADLGITVGAVCVYHEMVPVAVQALRGSGVPVAAVSTGFPAGLSPFPTRVEEIVRSVSAGAAEIDVVISRRLALTHDWQGLYEELRSFREACGEAHMKVILATGELGTLRNVYRASLVAMMAGADFIKTSTGKEAINATLPAGIAMAAAIRTFHERTGFRAGLKPAGGIRTASQALQWLTLVETELGPEWCTPDRFRIGASALVADIARELESLAT